jgi:hypothetical protein
MKRDIHFFVKVFSEESFRDEFLNGSLYMNALKYFRGLKEETKHNIADKHEGAYQVSQPHELTLSVNGVQINPEDLVGPIIFSMNWMEQINVFCLTYLHSHGILSQDSFDEDEYELLKSYYRLPEESYNLGEYAAVIHNVPEFMKRVKRELGRCIDNQEIDEYSYKPVEYYDGNTDSFAIDDASLDSAFKKNNKYAHQSEFRVAVRRENDECKEYRIEIGDIRDIVWVCNTKEINENIKVVAKK